MPNKINSIVSQNPQSNSILSILPHDVRVYMFSNFLDDKALSNVNKSCTLFYLESKATLKERQSLNSLTRLLSLIEMKLGDVEQDLQDTSTSVKHVENVGYLIISTLDINNRLDFCIHELRLTNLVRVTLPVIRVNMLSVICRLTLCEEQGIKVEEAFRIKFNEIRTRFENKFGHITQNEINDYLQQYKAILENTLPVEAEKVSKSRKCSLV